MDHIPTPIDAFLAVSQALTEKKRKELSAELKVLQSLVDPKLRSGPGSHWQDPERGARAREAMKASWAARRAVTGRVQLTWRGSKEQLITSDYDEIAKLVGRSPHTVKIYLSKGKGVAHFYHGDDVITVQKIVQTED